jgi:hypothetical protein
MAGRRLYLNNYIGQYSGEFGPDDYVRKMINAPENVRAVCKKPRYTKKQKKQMAERPQVKRFVTVSAEAKAIYHDPVQRAEWEKRHAAFIAKARKKGDYTYPRLWDYLRHMLNESKKAAENPVQ